MAEGIDPGRPVYRFDGMVEPSGRVGGTLVIMFPYSVEALFGTRGHVRMLGLLNNVPIDRSLIPNGDGTHFITISRELCRKARLKPGAKATVELQRNENPAAVTLPEELQAALDLEPGAEAAFQQITPGMQRSMAYWINSGKRPETRAQRAVNMLNRLLAGEFTRPSRKPRTEE